MHRASLRLGVILAAVVLTASVGVIAASASAASVSTSAGQSFSGKICGLLSASQLSAADINAGCVQTKMASKTLVTYNAHWGANGNAPHWLLVTVMKPMINAAFFYAKFKAGASRNGAPIGIGSWAYWGTERYNGDRRTGSIRFRAGAYVCQISLNDDNGAPDEVGIEYSLFSIAKTMAAKLK